MSKIGILSVSQFIDYINQALEPFSRATVAGEVIDFRINRRKWVGFDLKDEETEQILPCFTSFSLFKSMGLADVLEDGMRVQVEGAVKVRKKGHFSMFVKEIELAGEGTLKKAYEKLKAKLEKEGFFAEERKRAIPEFPQKIGIITSQEARAFSDFLKVLKERMGGLEVFHINVHVQGKNAVGEITRAFEYFNNNQDRFKLELVVLTRGGGSLEDLQAFNSEKVAKAVFSAKMPVVCGVGHEEDVTLSGLTADLRASTPSNAAELIVRDRQEVISEIEGMIYKIDTSIRAKIGERKESIERFYRAASNFIRQRRSGINSLLQRFQRELVSFESKLKDKREELLRGKRMLLGGMRRIYLEAKKFISYQQGLLSSYSPKSVLKRGYSIVKKEGRIIKDTAELEPEDSLKVGMHKGSFQALVEKIFNL